VTAHRSDEEIERARVNPLPLHDAPIELVPYDPGWPGLFAREAARIRAALGDRALLVEHVGSTSVPGLAAKPILDIVLTVADSADEPAYVPALQAAGYVLRIREPGWLEHRMLRGEGPTVNLHVFSAGCPEVGAMLTFRDRLRSHPADRERYAARKQELARRRWRHVQHYADAKSGVVAAIRLDAYLDELTRRLVAHLGDDLVAAWVAGSTALGDFDPRRSDVDVQAVAAARLPRADLRCLAAALSHSALPCPVRGLEFVLYAREDLTGAAFLLNLNTGPRMAQHEGYDPDAEPRFWFVLDLAIAAQKARPLAGAAPADVLPHMPDRLVRASLRDALDFYGAEDPAQTVLAACRALAWAADGHWRSKGEAARWALTEVPDPEPVAAALAHRSDATAPGPAPGPAAELVAFARSRLDRPG
jgi:GrpB-like predicted nucleotidyltransferase (UPF0157 family)